MSETGHLLKWITREGTFDYSHDGPCTLENCQSAKEIAKERGLGDIEAMLCAWGCGRVHHGGCSNMVSRA